MFIKIKEWKVKKGEDGTVIYDELIRETLYEADTASFESIPPDKEEDIGKTRLTITLGNPEDGKNLFFPWESKEKVTEIYCMSNEGKTVDRYIY